jgi:hypothetical protein
MSMAASSTLAVLIRPLLALEILFECRAGAFCMVYLWLDAEQVRKYIIQVDWILNCHAKRSEASGILTECTFRCRWRFFALLRMTCVIYTY